MMEPIIEVDHHQLVNNYLEIKKILPETCHVMAVVKSDAYGHGMIEVSQTLADYVTDFGVGFLREGIKLREAGIAQNICVFGSTYDFALAMEHNLTITVENMKQAQALFDFVQNTLDKTSKRIDIQIKVDTGMRRFGFSFKEFKEVLTQYESSQIRRHIRVIGLFSHFATNCVTNKKAVIRQQQEFERFRHWHMSWKETFEKREGFTLYPCQYHIANSENAIDLPSARYDMVRIGNALFGPVTVNQSIPLKRVATVKLPVVSVHEIERDQRLGYGQRKFLSKGTVIAVCEGGFYEGIGLVKSPAGQDKLYRIKSYLREMLKSILRDDLVYWNNDALPIVGMVNMQYCHIDTKGKPIKVGDYITVKKAPLYMKESVKRQHVLEDHYEIDN